MNNLSKIQKVSRMFYWLLTILIFGIPVYYVGYWLFINHLPETLITVNAPATPLIPQPLAFKFQLAGLFVCLLPLSALIYGLVNIRRLFSHYVQGSIFSFEHVDIFKKIAKSLLSWVILSMIYESVKSVLFSLSNPPGSRMISVSFGSPEITTLMVGSIAMIIAWVMDEGRILAEEKELTI